MTSDVPTGHDRTELARPGRTNILLLTADDMEATTPAVFGGLAGTTPRLDRLAGEGMAFTRAHVAIAVCQPSRSAIMTGRWPHRNGAEGFQSIRDDIPLLTRMLATVGYRTGILGKVTHLQPVERFCWDTAVDMAELGMGRSPAHYAERAGQFFDDAGDQPWFLMVNAHDPHRPFHGGDDIGAFFDAAQQSEIPEPSRVFGADEVSPPGYLPDLAGVRREYAQYLSSARRCDDVVAAVLDRLDHAGLAGSTLVVFLSDNGMAFPFSKANCYLQSTHTPFMVRWPGVVTPGSRNDAAFVSMLDLFPTFCDVAGIHAGTVDGTSLTSLLSGGTSPDPRDHIVTVFHETAARRRYEMRCVQDDRYGYIWNAWADGVTEYWAENMIGLSWPAMLEAADRDTEVAARVAFYRNRTPEELYDLAADPYSLHNLADDRGHADALRRARGRLLGWMREAADPLLTTYEAFLPR